MANSELLKNFDKAVDRRKSCCIKWDRGPAALDPNIIPMWIADTDFESPREVSEAIIRRCAHPVFGYGFPPAALTEGFINWFKERHDIEISRDWIQVGTGVVTAISYSVQAFTQPGDKVLIQTPVYDPFKAVISGTGRQPVESRLLPKDGRWCMDFEDLERRFAEGVKMIVLCNPHNPVGSVWTREELGALADLCRKYNVYITSDEIHCDFGLFGNRYTSMLSFPQVRHLTVCCTAPGKTFNISGLAISLTVVPDETLREKLSTAFRSAWLINPNLLGLEAAAAAYTHGADWHDAQLEYLEENSRLVKSRLEKEAPHIRPAVHEGTFMMWLDFSDFKLSNEALEEEIVHKWHIRMNSGWHYGPGGDGFMRMNIGTRRELINTALDRLADMHRAYFK